MTGLWTSSSLIESPNAQSRKSTRRFVAANLLYSGDALELKTEAKHYERHQIQLSAMRTTSHRGRGEN
jgi:hypothetical protein